MSKEAQSAENGQPPVTFTIDGVEFTTDDRRQTAADLLQLAEVDPDDHDLARIVGQDVEQKFADADEIQLTPDAKFVTIFTGATPVV